MNKTLTYNDDEFECACRKPLDDDLGFCFGCGLWINYMDRDQS